MGLFSFLKNAGASLFKSDSEEKAAKTVDPEEQKMRRHRVLLDTIRRHNLQIDNLSLRLDGSSVTVSGESPSQAEREKVILALGNVHGIDAVNDNITVPKGEAQSVFYTVVKGDTLSKIAKAHYGDAMKYPAIFEANRPMLSDPDKIYPGQVLRIPPQQPK